MSLRVYASGTISALAHSTASNLGSYTDSGVFQLALSTDDGVTGEQEYFRVISYVELEDGEGENFTQTEYTAIYDGTQDAWIFSPILSETSFKFQVSWWRDSVNPPDTKDINWKIYTV